MSKEFINVSDNDMENVTGGTNIKAKDMDLVYRGEKVKERDLVYTGDKKKAIKLTGKTSEIDGKQILGDFTDKSNFC